MRMTRKNKGMHLMRGQLRQVTASGDTKLHRRTGKYKLVCSGFSSVTRENCSVVNLGAVIQTLLKARGYDAQTCSSDV